MHILSVWLYIISQKTKNFFILQLNFSTYRFYGNYMMYRSDPNLIANLICVWYSGICLPSLKSLAPIGSATHSSALFWPFSMGTGYKNDKKEGLISFWQCMQQSTGISDPMKQMPKALVIRVLGVITFLNSLFYLSLVKLNMYK